jgi:hypothetical protein
LVTNQQLYLAIGIPMLFNATLLALFAAHVNTRFDAINQRFDDMRDCGTSSRASPALFSP